MQPTVNVETAGSSCIPPILHSQPIVSVTMCKSLCLFECCFGVVVGVHGYADKSFCAEALQPLPDQLQHSDFITAVGISGECNASEAQCVKCLA